MVPCLEHRVLTSPLLSTCSVLAPSFYFYQNYLSKFENRIYAEASPILDILCTPPILPTSASVTCSASCTATPSISIPSHGDSLSHSAQDLELLAPPLHSSRKASAPSRSKLQDETRHVRQIWSLLQGRRKKGKGEEEKKGGGEMEVMKKGRIGAS